MDRLFLNDVEMELSQDTTIAINFQINELGELRNRQANYSNRFRVPLTQHNLKTVEDCDMIQSDTLIPYRKARARVIKNGMEVVPNGYAIIESIDTFINVTVYSGNVEFFDLIEGKKLSDLDLSAYDHTFEINTVYSSRSNTSGYKYSIVDFGLLLNSNRDVDVRNLRPAIFVKTLIDKIFSEAGFNKSGAIFSHPGYEKLLMMDGDLEHSDKFIRKYSFNANIHPEIFTNTLVGTHSYAVGLDNDSTGNFYDDSNKVTLGASALLGSPAAYAQTAERDHIKFTVRFVVSDWVDGTSLLQWGYFWGIEYTHPDTADGGGNGAFSFSSEIDAVPPYPNYFTPFYVEMDIAKCTVEIESGSFSGEPINNVLYGETVEAAGTVGDMLQSELIKAVVQKFCLLYKTGSATKTLIYKQFGEIAASAHNAVDWSSKLHMDEKTWKTEYRIGSYAQKNWLRYMEDSNDDDITKFAGDGSIPIDDLTLEKEKDHLTLPFAATKMLKRLKNLDVPLIRKIEDGEFKISTIPRILVDDTQDVIGTPVKYTEGDPFTDISDFVDVPLCYFSLSGKSFNLDFNALITANYPALADVLNRTKKFSGVFLLNETDIEFLDHFICVHLHNKAAYFYINKVINYTGVGLTRVELIRLFSSAIVTQVDRGVLPGVELEEDGGFSLREDFGKSKTE